MSWQKQPAADGSRVWVPGIIECIARFLPANEVACILRLLDKTTSQLLASSKTVRLSLPSPTDEFKRRWGSPVAFRGLTREQRLKLLCLTAASGSIANLEVALASAGLLISCMLLDSAATAGQLTMCKWLRERGCPWPGGVSLAAAARGGHRHVCEWLLVSGCPVQPFMRFAVQESARSGQEGLVHWLIQQSRSTSADPIDVGSLLVWAAYGFSLPALQRLHQQLLAGQQQQQQGAGGGGGEVRRRVIDTVHHSYFLAAAAGSPTPDWQAKVLWLEGLGYPRDSIPSTGAAGAAHDAVGRMQWLYGRGYPLCQAALMKAAFRGDMAAVRFLVEDGGVKPFYSTTMHVARAGHLDVLQFFHAKGCEMSPWDLARNAAEGGHLPVVAWAAEALQGVTPDNAMHLLDMAARSGSIALMAWLRERGWAWGRDAMGLAALCGCEEVLEWLVAHGCPWPDDGGQAYKSAACSGDLATLRCLHRLGCPWGPQPLLAECIRRGAPDPALRCLVEELGCPVDMDAAERAARERDLVEMRTGLLEWLAEERQRRL